MRQKKETELSVLKEIRDLLKGKTLNEIKTEEHRFIKLSDGWIKDKLLGIDWAPKSVEKKLNWKEAQEYAKDFGRQPSRFELESLIDLSKHKPALVTGALILDLSMSDWYWTRETYADFTGFAWVVNFYKGFVYNGDKDDGGYVRPVRSSQ